jgi:CRP-like cAMP-binding protein
MPDYSFEYRRDLLAQHFLFRKLTLEEVDHIASISRQRRYADGQVVFQRGDAASGMYAVLQGRVRISLYSDDGKEIVLNIVERGCIFGEIAIFDGKPRAADAFAMGECLLLTIERREFVALLERHPALAIRIIEFLCEYLRRTNSLVEDIVFLDLPGRLARLLLRLAANYGEETPNGLRLGLKLSQREFGSLVAASRETVNKQLRAWEESGVLAIDKGQITLLKRRSLEEIAEGKIE